MALSQTDVNALQVGIGAIPMLVDLIKGIRGVSNPSDPPLTDEQVLAILVNLGNASIAKDDALKLKLGGQA